MDYTIKCFYDPSGGRNYENLMYVGGYRLADETTYNHYLNLLTNRTPFNIGFESFDMTERAFVHHLINVIPGQMVWGDGENTANEKIILIVTPIRANISSISAEEYHDEAKINEMLERIGRQNLTRFFNK